MLKRTVLFALVLLVSAAPGLLAFTFQPITQEFAPAGERASHVFRVVNTTETQIAVRISIRPRTIEPDGSEIQGAISDDFVVYPARMLLEPGDARSVRVAWTGGVPEQELAYRIIAEQLPVNTNADEPEQGGAIVLTYRYEGSVYVVPPGARAELETLSVEPSVEPEGRRALRVTVRNKGTRHTLLTDPRLELRTSPSEDPFLSLGPDELVGLAGENMLAGTTRHFFVELPDNLPDQRVYGTIILDDN